MAKNKAKICLKIMIFANSRIGPLKSTFFSNQLFFSGYDSKWQRKMGHNNFLIFFFKNRPFFLLFLRFLVKKLPFFNEFKKKNCHCPLWQAQGSCYWLVWSKICISPPYSGQKRTSVLAKKHDFSRIWPLKSIIFIDFSVVFR